MNSTSLFTWAGPHQVRHENEGALQHPQKQGVRCPWNCSHRSLAQLLRPGSADLLLRYQNLQNVLLHLTFHCCSPLSFFDNLDQPRTAGSTRPVQEFSCLAPTGHAAARPFSRIDGRQPVPLLRGRCPGLTHSRLTVRPLQSVPGSARPLPQITVGGSRPTCLPRLAGPDAARPSPCRRSSSVTVYSPHRKGQPGTSSARDSGGGKVSSTSRRAARRAVTPWGRLSRASFP